MRLPKYSMSTRRTGREVAITVETNLGAEQSRVFDYIAGESVLPEVLTGYTPLLPAVVSTSGRTGPWDVPGSWRTVHLKDGSTAREEVTDYDRPKYFAYKTSEFTFALRHLATGATGQWRLETALGVTTVRWTYTFAGRGWLSPRLLAVFARFLWSGYMRVCLFNVQRHFAAIAGPPDRSSARRSGCSRGIRKQERLSEAFASPTSSRTWARRGRAVR
jgi:hypothetical protein